MAQNPYAWKGHKPKQPVMRGALVAQAIEHLRRGAAVKITGARGMGKSVLLQQIASQLDEPGTRVVLIGSPPEEATVAGAVRDLAARLGIRDLSLPRMDDLLDRVLQGEVTRLVVLFDEADQYVAFGGAGDAFARAWFNKLEATRKARDPNFAVAFAGGLGLFYLEHELGSGIVGRAEDCSLDPFGPEEIAALASPFEQDGRPLDDTCLSVLRALSGGIPALVTYGLEQLWNAENPTASALEPVFGTFREQYASFIQAIYNSISRQGQIDAPRRVLGVVRQQAGAVALQRLREACFAEGERETIDPKQALKLLRAAGLIRIEGSTLADPVVAWPIASILNLPETPAASGDPLDRLVQDVSAVLSNLRRFGRDFHREGALLHEEVFSSLIAVGLRLLGWVDTEREPVQSAGYPDIKVRLTQPGLAGHTLIETKIWPRNDYKDIQKQVEDYRVADSRHGVAVMLGVRGAAGWPEDYEKSCFAGRDFKRLPTPPDLVGRWQVLTTDSDGQAWITDHLLVQIPKRD